MEHSVRFKFVASNNEAEYKALLLGINIFYNSRARILSAYSDSQLIVGQDNGEFEAKDDGIRMYLQKVKVMIKPTRKIQHFSYS